MASHVLLRAAGAHSRLYVQSMVVRQIHASTGSLAASSSSSTASPAPTSSAPSQPSFTSKTKSAPATTSSQAGPSGMQSELSHAQGPEWLSNDFSGMSQTPFPAEVADILMGPLEADDVEITPDGLLYLPEIKYRRILNRAFGPGGWGLAPRGQSVVSAKVVSREWALLCLGRLVAVARGEQNYFDPDGIPTAAEGAKSNALMRCCKDLGIASELWDPRYIRTFKAAHAIQVWTESRDGKKKQLWRRKDGPPFTYPWREKKM